MAHLKGNPVMAFSLEKMDGECESTSKRGSKSVIVFPALHGIEGYHSKWRETREGTKAVLPFNRPGIWFNTDVIQLRVKAKFNSWEDQGCLLHRILNSVKLLIQYSCRCKPDWKVVAIIVHSQATFGPNNSKQRPDRNWSTTRSLTALDNRTTSCSQKHQLSVFDLTYRK